MWRLLLIIFLGFSACNRSQVLAPQKMEQVLADLIRVEAYAQEHATTNLVQDNTNSAAQQKAIFAKHKITREQFLKSLEFYETHPEQFSPIMDSVNKRFQNINQAIVSLTPIKADTVSNVQVKPDTILPLAIKRKLKFQKLQDSIKQIQK